ncbi:MAG: ERAP1-like C-terminal domain-containing protein, partial [Acidimicrobiales bacterium]
LFSSLGWEPVPGEDQRTSVLRGRLLGALGTIGADELVQAEARSRFGLFLEERSSLSPDLVSAVVGVVAASGDASTYQLLKDQYLATSNPQDKVRYLQSLAGFEDEALLAQTLDYCLTDEVRAQDAPFVMGAVAGSRSGARYAWAWLPEHWDQITAKFPALMLLRVLEGMTGVVDPALAADVRAFIAGHDLPVAGPRVAQLEERMDINVSLAQRVAGTISSVLNATE